MRKDEELTEGMRNSIKALIKEFNGEIKLTPGHSNLLRIVREKGIISSMVKVVPSVRTFERALPIMFDKGTLKIVNGFYYIKEEV